MISPSKIEVIRDFQGNRTQNEFADLLGMTSGGLSLVLTGKRGANGVLIRLLTLFPEKSKEINAAMVLPESLAAALSAPERETAEVA